MEDMLIDAASAQRLGPPRAYPSLNPALQAALWNALAETLARLHPSMAETITPVAVAPVPPQSLAAGPLTAREQQVLARIAAGESNKVIARGLALSPHTIKRHVANVLAKLDAGSRGQAAAWWQANRGMPA